MNEGMQVVAYVPTKQVLDHLRVKDQLRLWPQIVEDLDAANTSPAKGFDRRLRKCGARYEAFCEPGVYDGEPALWVLWLRERGAIEAVPAERQIVGRETRRQKYGKSYGAGRRWPSSWNELKARILAHPGAELVPGGKHLSVLLNGKVVSTLPVTASDHRSLLNACQGLRQVGIDVSR